MQTAYQFDDEHVIAEVKGGAVQYRYLRSLTLDEAFVREGFEPEFYHIDGLGSTLVLTDQAGSPKASYAYQSFGETTPSGGSTNPFQYAGRENDETGLYFYRARYYDSVLSRFIAVDPAVFMSQDMNAYVYVANGPLDFIDPVGLAKDRSRQKNRQGGKGPLSGSDEVIQEAKEIARKEGGEKGAQHIEKEMKRLESENKLSKKRAKQLQGAKKLLKEAGKQGAKTGAKVVPFLGPLLELLLPDELAPAEIPATSLLPDPGPPFPEVGPLLPEVGAGSSRKR